MRSDADVAEMDEELVPVATFLFADEAKVARTLLQSASIQCYIENEHALSAVWTLSVTLGWLRLMVPVSAAEESREILHSTIFEEELDGYPIVETKAESTPGERGPVFSSIGRGGRRARVILGFPMLFSPAIERLRLFYL